VATRHGTRSPRGNHGPSCCAQHHGSPAPLILRFLGSRGAGILCFPRPRRLAPAGSTPALDSRRPGITASRPAAIGAWPLCSLARWVPQASGGPVPGVLEPASAVPRRRVFFRTRRFSRSRRRMARLKPSAPVSPFKTSCPLAMIVYSVQRQLPFLAALRGYRLITLAATDSYLARPRQHRPWRFPAPCRAVKAEPLAFKGS